MAAEPLETKLRRAPDAELLAMLGSSDFTEPARALAAKVLTERGVTVPPPAPLMPGPRPHRLPGKWLGYLAVAAVLATGKMVLFPKPKSPERQQFDDFNRALGALPAQREQIAAGRLIVDELKRCSALADAGQPGPGCPR